MGQLAEIVFEHVKPSVFKSLVSAFLGKTRLTHEQELMVGHFLATQEDAAIVLSPICMARDAIHIDTGAIRILRYGQDYYDVEFTWDLDECVGIPTRDVIAAVHQVAVAVAEEQGVEHYYGGLEPACDEDTRFFTGRTRGPLLMM
jgi:hypothetical protein